MSSLSKNTFKKTSKRNSLKKNLYYLLFTVMNELSSIVTCQGKFKEIEKSFILETQEVYVQSFAIFNLLHTRSYHCNLRYYESPFILFVSIVERRGRRGSIKEKP